MVSASMQPSTEKPMGTRAFVPRATGLAADERPLLQRVERFWFVLLLRLAAQGLEVEARPAQGKPSNDSFLLSPSPLGSSPGPLAVSGVAVPASTTRLTASCVICAIVSEP